MSSIKCPQCNLTNWSTAPACKRCQYPFQVPEEFAEFDNAANIANESAYSSQNQNQGYSQNYQQYNSPPQNSYQPNQQYQNYQQPNYAYYQPANQKSGLAIASMVLGILGFVTAMLFVGILIAPIGLIFGIVALVKANRKPQLYGGKAFAIVGVVMSSMVVCILPVILAIAIPNLLAARRAANEGSTIASLRTLAAAEATYIATIGAGKCGDLQELSKAGLIDTVLAAGQKSGYKFVIAKTTTNNRCEITAVPTVTKGVSATGIRSFFISTDENVIHAAAKSGALADRNDLPLGGSTEASYPNSPNQPTQISSRSQTSY